MKYLLDTHTFLWAIGETEKLSKKVLNIKTRNDWHVFCLQEGSVHRVMRT